jgi:hypothetical protein
VINQLVGKAVGQYTGPILVVGGAPGVLEELELLHAGGYEPTDHLIISANEHAIHAGLWPDFCCANDDIHSTLRVHQEPRLRELMPTTRLLSRHWWADYRSPQLLACNSGLKALLYAAILGANPIIVIGIQHYSNGLYFHPDSSRKKNPNLDRGEAYFRKQTSKLQAMLKGVPVRPVSGPLTQLWPKWDPAETFKQRDVSELERKAQADAATQRYVYTKTVGVAFEGALVPERMIFAVTEREMRNIVNADTVMEVTDLENVSRDLAADQERSRAEHARYIRMVSKVRASRRGVRRGIADGDIVRIIRRVESGESASGIAKLMGLPAEQVGFMVKTMGLDSLAAVG